MSWAEEMAAMEAKRAARRVRTPEGAEQFDQPIGTIITPGLPGGTPGAPKAKDKRHAQGQTKGNFTHPVTGHAMGKTEIGDTYEQLFQAKMRKELEREFGCCLKLITGAGEGTARNTPLDFEIGGTHGGEVKTLSALSKNQKTAIKSEEVERKVKAVDAKGWEPLLVVQVVNQQTGEVSVYAHPAFESKAVSRMRLLGSYKYGEKDFRAAQEKSGHWEKAKARYLAEQKKAGTQTATQTKARLGERYDPPDEEGGVIEPGDTVIELRGGVPYIYTFPREDGDREAEPEKKAHPGEGGREGGSEGARGRRVVTYIDERNEDWAKTSSWDIWLGSTLVKTLPQLTEYCRFQRMELDHFLTLPAAEAMPDELRDEVRLWAQEQAAEGGGTGEKALFRRVKTPEGARHYDQPVGTPIKPDVVPNKPTQLRPGQTMSSGGTSGTRSVASTPTPGPDPGGPADGKIGSSAGHYGTMSVTGWLDGMSEGKFKSWTAAYRAAWLGGDGEVDAVADHDALPGGRERGFVDGRIRIALADYPKNPMLNLQIRGKANQRQVDAILELAKETEAQKFVVSVHGNDRGDGEPVNGEFPFNNMGDLRRFLTDPTKRPEKKTEDPGRAFIMNRKSVFWIVEGHAYDPSEDGFCELCDETKEHPVHLDDDELAEQKLIDQEDMEAKGVRRVRSAAGARLYDQPIGSIIRPDVPGSRKKQKPKLTVKPSVSSKPSASKPSASTAASRTQTQTSQTAATTPDRDVIGMLTEAIGAGGDRNVQVGMGGKPNKTFTEREARLRTDPGYAAAFEKQLGFITRQLPADYQPSDPLGKNPEYKSYVDDLNRRIAHAMVEPGPLHFDAATEKVVGDGFAVIQRLAQAEIDAADRRGVPSNKNRTGTERPVLVVAAGVSGAGKTTSLKALGGDLAGIEYPPDPKKPGKTLGVPSNFIVPNPDDFKERMIESGDLPSEYGELGINPDETALLTHELSSSTNKALMQLILGDPADPAQGGYNAILDATYEGPMLKRIAELQLFKDAGYEHTAILVDGEIATSLERATARHISISSLPDTPRKANGDPDFGKVRLNQPGGVDELGMPDGGFDGRYVPSGLIGDQIVDDRPVLSTEAWQWVMAQVQERHGVPVSALKKDPVTKIDPLDALMREAAEMFGQVGPSWGGDSFKSSNAKNFENSIRLGLFDRWVVVDSNQNVVARGEGSRLIATKAHVAWLQRRQEAREALAVTAERNGMETKSAGPGRSKARHWLATSTDRLPILMAIIEWDEGRMPWPEVVRYVTDFQLAPTLQPGEQMWAEAEDAFPQAGTGDEIGAAFVSGVITRQQMDELHKAADRKKK
jgi:hypothetical protein